MFVFKAHLTPVASLAFSPDGSWLASASTSGYRVWPTGPDPLQVEVDGC